MSASGDRNFDDRADWFRERIYGSRKGDLRLALLWEQLCDDAPMNAAPLSIWDAGGGQGQMSILCAQQGHRVLLTDISAQMLAHARSDIGVDAELGGRITVQQASIQDVAARGDQFDLVICHAVLEWLQYPRETLLTLLSTIKPGGYLSLAFYNANALVLMNAIKGNFHKARAAQLAGDEGSLTPTAPQSPFEVEAWLRDAGLDIIGRAGVRVFFDLMNKPLAASRTLENLLQMERELSRQEGFWSLGRYVHFVARRLP